MNRLRHEIPGINYGIDFSKMEQQIINYVRKLKEENKKLKEELKRLTPSK